MFTNFRFKNFRTHVDTEVRLGPVTLIIGPNSSGKTNLLLALRDFAYFGRLARSGTDTDVTTESKKSTSISDYGFFNRNRFVGNKEPIEFSCDWTGQDGTKLSYSIAIRQLGASRSAKCVEALTLMYADGRTKEKQQSSDRVQVSKDLFEDPNWNESEKIAVRKLFRDLGSIYYFKFESSALKNYSDLGRKTDEDQAIVGEMERAEKDKKPWLNIPGELGQDGRGLHTVLQYIKSEPREAEVYDKFRVLMEQFSPDFRDYAVIAARRAGGERPKWGFVRRGDNTVHRYEDSLLADGFLRAAAISVVAAMNRPPSIVLLEELENGMDIVRLELMVDWIFDAAARLTVRNNSQFVITSHSPIVLRRFANRLQAVFQSRYDPEQGRSIVLNLEDLLKSDIKRGHVKGRLDGERASVSPDTLVNLWVNRAIGGEPLWEEGAKDPER